MEQRRSVLSTGVEKLFDLIGEIAGLIALLTLVITILNAVFNFLPVDSLQIINAVKYYSTLIAIVALGLEFSSKRGFVVFVIFLVIAAIAVIFSFMPDTWNEIVTLVTNAVLI